MFECAVGVSLGLTERSGRTALGRKTGVGTSGASM
jgi:hypothetical protein